MTRTHRAYGLALRTDAQPPGAWSDDAGAAAEGPVLELRVGDADAVAARWSGRAALGWAATIDGARLEVEVGRAGDHRFAHGTARHHLDAGGATLLCAPAGQPAPLWWRVVLDSVLFSAALLAGREALHAGAVATPAGAVAIAAQAGGGKSTLLAALLARGLPLVADDVLVLEGRAEAAPLAHPAPPLMTVPAALDGRLGAPLAELGDERWIAVPTVAGPLPLAAFVLLDRRPGAPLELQPLAAPLAPLLGALLRFPAGAERELARFERASEIAAHAPVWRLSAGLDVPAERLAAVLLERLGTG
jgi:hypothetical protein